MNYYFYISWWLLNYCPPSSAIYHDMFEACSAANFWVVSTASMPKYLTMQNLGDAAICLPKNENDPRCPAKPILFHSTCPLPFARCLAENVPLQKRVNTAANNWRLPGEKLTRDEHGKEKRRGKRVASFLLFHHGESRKWRENLLLTFRLSLFRDVSIWQHIHMNH